MPAPSGLPPHSLSDPLFGAPIRAGGWLVRLAQADDMAALFDLRARAFRGGAEDRDSHDADSLHLWVGAEGGPPRATLRLRRHAAAAALLTGYAARHYDLTALAATGGEALELGRLCTDPALRGRAGQGDGVPAPASQTQGDADPLRLLWAGVARLVLATGAARLVGCTSFHTTDAEALDPAWALLAARHLGPAAARPGRKAPRIRGFEQVTARPEAESAALLPPLLRAYLGLGGWVSDHAVIDRDLGTCHVFTCVEVATLPPARRRVLEQMAAG